LVLIAIDNSIAILFYCDKIILRGGIMLDVIEKQYQNIKKSSNIISLLRYPGGKTRAVKFILPYFPKNITTLFSPFFGGGSIEIALANRGVKVYGYDIFEPLVAFWQCALENPNKLADIVLEYYPLSKEKFYELQDTLDMYKDDKYRYAAIFYVLNRASYSGATCSGGMSPNHPRFTLSAIERLRNFSCPNIVSITNMDFTNSFKLHTQDFVYADPPYMIESSLYGKKGDAHKNFDHDALYEILKQRGGWILSYNNCDKVKKMYSRYKIVYPVWKYGMSNNKNSREILILSNDW